VAGMEEARVRRLAAVGLVLLAVAVGWARTGGQAPTLEELKERVAKASVADRPPLCVNISERQLSDADRLYVAGDSERAQAALADVAAYSEFARDYAVQSHKHEKQSEIAIRKMVRKLEDIKHAVAHDDQEQVQITIDRLQRVRDDLQAAMFQKGDKK
jgi:hypothetical protein